LLYVYYIFQKKRRNDHSKGMNPLSTRIGDNEILFFSFDIL
jgi:hypothetical protein